MNPRAALRRAVHAVRADARWQLPTAVALLVTAVVACAPAWWGQAARTVAGEVRRFWLPVLLAAAGLGVLVSWYRRWRAAPRPTVSASVARRWPLFGHVSVLLLGGVLAAAGIGALVWWALGSPTLHRPATPAPPPTSGVPAGPRPAEQWSVQNTFDAIKIVLSLVAGIGAVVALTVAYRKQALGEAAEHREEAKEAREDTKLFNERFAKASEQLGSDKAAVRLAGVYALTGLADDWKDGRQTCIEVLCAYLRMPYTPPADEVLTDTATPVTAEAGDVDKQAERRQERQVRHTILDVIGEHLRPPHQNPRPRWHGHRFNLSGAVIDGGNLHHIDIPDGTVLNFRGATFSDGTVDFGDATFAGGTVDFGAATFADGTVSFSGATFSGSTVDFSLAEFSSGTVDAGAATFSGGTVDFTGAEFSGTTVSLRGAEFSGSTVDFGGAEFAGGTVAFGGATFSDGTVAFNDAELSGGTVAFNSATFSDGTVDFSDATFSGSAVAFNSARFAGGTVAFNSARFAGGTVDFNSATFSGGMYFRGKVSFDGAKISGGVVDLSAPRLWWSPPTELDASAPGVRWPTPEHLARLPSDRWSVLTPGSAAVDPQTP